MTQYYTETVFRYTVQVVADLPEEHKAHYRAEGIDPENNWSLRASFLKREDAQKHLDRVNEEKFILKSKIHDFGETQHIQRPFW